jgi:hypothetical protein
MNNMKMIIQDNFGLIKLTEWSGNETKINILLQSQTKLTHVKIKIHKSKTFDTIFKE